MNCISINYKKANAQIRGAFAFDINKQKKFLSEIAKNNGAYGVILCTCNRTEIYFCCCDEENILSLLSLYSGTDTQIIKQTAMFFCGAKALSHLFCVCCGVDSMVIGEDEILSQTKNAYQNSQIWGNTNSELNIIFQSAFACAKKIKTETALSNVSVSVATLAANCAAKSGREILVIGASGKIGQIIAKDLLSHKNKRVIATIRKHSPDMYILSDSRIKCVPFDERYDHIDSADCIISATSSPHYIFTRSEAEKYINTPKRRLFIDLAVPHDIDKEISKIENTTLIDIDYFKNIAADNNIKKMHSAELAKKMIQKQCEEVQKTLALQNFLAENYGTENNTLLYKLRSSLSAEQFSAVLNAMKKE